MDVLLRQMQFAQECMNNYDRENLEFLLNATPELLANWYDTVSDDDKEYASELLAQYSKELALRQRFNAVEEVIVDDLVPDAAIYLKKFRLTK